VNFNMLFSTYISNYGNFHADSLCVNLSYMGTIEIQVVGPKAYIDANTPSKCFMEAFEEIKEASIYRKLWNLNLSVMWEREFSSILIFSNGFLQCDHHFSLRDWTRAPSIIKSITLMIGIEMKNTTQRYVNTNHSQTWR